MSSVAYIAAHREKRAGKDECFSVVKKLSKGDCVEDSEIAALYSYFLPTRTKKITNPFEWAASACDQKTNYAFTKYVEVTNRWTVGANIQQANIVYSNLGLEPGFYDISGGCAGDDVAIMPNVAEVKEQSAQNHASEFEVESLDVVETPSGLAYILPWNDKGIGKDMLDGVMRSVDSPCISYSLDGPFSVSGFIRKTPCISVMMPVTIVGLRKSVQTNNSDKTVSDTLDLFATA